MNTRSDEEFVRRIFAGHNPAPEPQTINVTVAHRKTSADSSQGHLVPRPRRRRWQTPLIAAALVLVVLAGGSAALMGGFEQANRASSPGVGDEASGNAPRSQPDISAEGRVAYACSLALDAQRHGEVATWSIGVGSRSGPAWQELAAVPGLLSALVGAAPVGYPELRDAGANLASGVASLELTKAQQGLNSLVAWCTTHPKKRQPRANEMASRVSYACALARDASTYGPIDVEAWSITTGDGAGAPWRNLTAIPGLLGVNIGLTPEGFKQLSDAATDIQLGVIHMDLARAQAGLNEFTKRCPD